MSTTWAYLFANSFPGGGVRQVLPQRFLTVAAQDEALGTNPLSTNPVTSKVERFHGAENRGIDIFECGRSTARVATQILGKNRLVLASRVLRAAQSPGIASHPPDDNRGGESATCSASVVVPTGKSFPVGDRRGEKSIPVKGLPVAAQARKEPKSCASANFATSACV